MQDLIKRYYEESFVRFPTFGSSAGRHEFDAEMGRIDPATLEAQHALVLETLSAIEDLPLQDFGGSDLLDRRTILANLRQDRLEYDLRRHENNPQSYLHGSADALYDLFIRNATNLKPVAPAIISRLKQIPRYLDEAAGNLKRPDPLWKDLALKAAPAVGGFFETLAEPLAAASGQPVATLRRLTKKAAAAAADYAARVKALRPAPAGSYALGEERFTLLMHERTGLPCSPREAAAIGRRLAAELAEAMRQEARKFHPTKPATEILEEAAAEWQPEGSLLDAYRATTQQMREAFVKAGWLDFPKNDRLLVQLVPDFMRDQFPTAAYSSPGALDPDQTGIFWVNDLSLIAPSEEKRRAEISQHFGLELTCAHEAYPGHHLQFVTQHRIPSLARKMAHHAIYYEGWTLWCEQMTADLGVSSNPYLRLIQLHDALWRAWRIVIDVGLHTGELTYDTACDVLVNEVGFTRARAQGDVNWYTASPTVPMSYLLGKAELLRLKHQRVDRGGMNLREFNNWILSFGAIPWRWIEESGL
jgi:uncharacterized protein (DUF885 family)